MDREYFSIIPLYNIYRNVPILKKIPLFKTFPPFHVRTFSCTRFFASQEMFPVQVTTVQCPKPENPVNGNAVYTSYAYNSIVSYECKYGYTVVGATTRRCGADRKWTGKTPTCQEINCGSPGVLYNGWIENIEAGESHDGTTKEILY